MQTIRTCALRSGYLYFLVAYWYFFTYWLMYLGVHYIKYIQWDICIDKGFSSYTVPCRAKTPQELSWDALKTSFPFLWWQGQLECWSDLNFYCLCKTKSNKCLLGNTMWQQHKAACKELVISIKYRFCKTVERPWTRGHERKFRQLWVTISILYFLLRLQMHLLFSGQKKKDEVRSKSFYVYKLVSCWLQNLQKVFCWFAKEPSERDTLCVSGHSVAKVNSCTWDIAVASGI